MTLAQTSVGTMSINDAIERWPCTVSTWLSWNGASQNSLIVCFWVRVGHKRNLKELLESEVEHSHSALKVRALLQLALWLIFWSTSLVPAAATPSAPARNFSFSFSKSWGRFSTACLGQTHVCKSKAEDASFCYKSPARLTQRWWETQAGSS